jgi:alkylated DNA nucleotide flippase Atl1
MTKSERAQQVWQVLVSAAHNRQVFTYGILANLIGMGPGTLARPLGCVMKYCEQQGLPPLTVLVVGKKTGTPGSGLETVDPRHKDEQREKVFQYKWFIRLPPSAEHLEAAGDGF